jgi:hypothetical protein
MHRYFVDWLLLSKILESDVAHAGNFDVILIVSQTVNSLSAPLDHWKCCGYWAILLVAKRHCIVRTTKGVKCI